MPTGHTRRDFLGASAAVGAGLVVGGAVHAGGPDKPVRVVVWDEQQPAQKEAYENFLGNWVARYLESRPGLAVKSVKLDDPGHGMSDEVLDGCDPKHMDWLGAVVLTLPWSLACLAFEPARENDQIWMTAPTIREQSWPIRRTVVRCLAWVEGPAGVRPKGLLC